VPPAPAELVLHVSVYQLARKYAVVGLKEMARDKFILWSFKMRAKWRLCRLRRRYLRILTRGIWG
jgi:hypothetical protein